MSLEENSKTYKYGRLKSFRVSLDYLDFLKLCSTIEDAGELKEVQETFQYRWNEESEKLWTLFLSTPEEFQIWAVEKKLAFNDLRPLFRADVPCLAPLLVQLAKLSPSKSVGCEILEKICDGSFEGSDFKLSPGTKSAETWLNELRLLSHPLTLGKDEARARAVERWPWPVRAKGQWRRRGDQAGLHLEIYSLNPDDLAQKLEELKKFSELWKKEL